MSSANETPRKKPEKAATPVPEEAEFLSIPMWKRSIGRWRKRISRGWKLYKQSKAGLLGFGIMIGFVVMAVFAPWIAPYSLDYLAPAEDVFKADSVTHPIEPNESVGMTDPASEHWYPPIGWRGDQRLEYIVAYSDSGHSVKYQMDDRALPDGGRGIKIVDVFNYSIPENVTKLLPVDFYRGDLFFAHTNTTLYELAFSSMAVRREVPLDFVPIWYSNLWNRWSSQNLQGALIYSFCNETSIGLYAKVPPRQDIGEVTERQFRDTIHLEDYNETNGTHIIGEPILLNVRTTTNGSMVIVPTNVGICAFELVYENNSIGWVRDISLGPPKWFVSYEEMSLHWDREVEPIQGGRPITIAKEDPSEELGKNRIVLATENGFLYSIWRRNGTLEWSSTLVAGAIREPVPIGLWPTYRGSIVVTGTNGEQAFIASVDRDTGDILGNRTFYNVTTTPPVGRPEYIPSSRNYIFMTENQQIVILKETMQLAAIFKAVGNGTATTIGYMGNIVNNVGSSQGNYYAMITVDGVLWVQSVSGTYRAPLPPGTYESGNRYILGTDVFGGDIFTQLVYATRTELVVGLVAAVISAGLGTLVGLIAGYYGGWIESLLMRLTDIFLTLPILVVALLLAAVLGPSIGNIILIIAIFSWAGVARVIRAQTLSLKSRSFIDAARVSGASNSAIIFRHLAPNVLPLTFLYMVFTISGAIITEAILAFLGMGDPTAVTWGMMLQFLQISGNTLTAPWWLLPPGIAITMLSLAFYLIGRAFDEVVNPRLRAR